MIPDIIKKFLLTNKESQGCFCLAINEKLNIIQYFGKIDIIGIKPPEFDMPIYKFLPALLTEAFDSDFEIPFYNINDSYVCNIYFLKFTKISYLVLVDKSEIFQVTQKYQQFAHDDNITKNKFKRLAEELAVAKQRLNKSDQEKATLIAVLSHEIGTPLTSILGYSELLLNKTGNVKKGLEIIRRNAIHLKQMIDNTLIFGRSEAGGLQVNIEEVAVQNLFNVLKATLLPVAQNKNLSLRMFHKGNEKINIDITITKQILINLLNNAIKYTQEGSIELKFSLKENQYIFSVIDTGLGIASELQDSIFNRWERIEENAEDGSGIGLYICQKLAKIIGAELQLKYSSKEFGSIFQLAIPAWKVIDSKENNTPNCQKKCCGQSILVIDDDRDILELIVALLHPCKLKIYTAINLTKALAILQENKIDLVLTDYNLDTIKASTILNQINKYNKTMPVLLMTAMPTDHAKANYLAQGFDAVITKPIDSKTLCQTIVNNL